MKVTANNRSGTEARWPANCTTNTNGTLSPPEHDTVNIGVNMRYGSTLTHIPGAEQSLEKTPETGPGLVTDALYLFCSANVGLFFSPLGWGCSTPSPCRGASRISCLHERGLAGLAASQTTWMSPIGKLIFGKASWRPTFKAMV